MSKLVIVRHGQSHGILKTGLRDIDLSPAGEKEAVSSGEKLKNYKFDDVCLILRNLT
jgi:bisphosphoglycerate-dependent phosphoglycerate mutase